MDSLDIKFLIWKLCTLLALTTAARAQTLECMNFKNMCLDSNSVVFHFTLLFEMFRPGRSNSISLQKYIVRGKKLCVVSTLHEYLKRLKKRRKYDQLLVSYKTFNKVSTSTVGRWIKDVMGTVGIDITYFKAHSIRSVASSSA